MARHSHRTTHHRTTHRHKAKTHKATHRAKKHTVKLGLIARMRHRHLQIARHSTHVVHIHSHTSATPARNPWQSIIV